MEQTIKTTPQPTLPSDASFWQNTDEDKSKSDIKGLLEQRAKTRQTMKGFQLRKTDLRDIDLVNHGHQQGYELVDSDLYRTNLQGAHLFNLNLKNSSLMKANLKGANLHCANLTGCNLLGTILTNARLDNVVWDEYVIQEKQALEKGKNTLNEKLDLLQQSEEIYRHLRKVTEAQGLFETAGHFFEREMKVRRYQMRPYSLDRILSKCVDLFCGYGERPLRVILCSVIMITGFALLYFSFGITDGGAGIQYDAALTLKENFINFAHCLYFSIVTFTTLGYGDLAPTGFARAIAASEAFLGSFTLALFVVVFVKKMTR